MTTVPQKQPGAVQPRTQIPTACQASGVMKHTALAPGSPARRADAGEERKPSCLQDSSFLSSPETLKTLGWKLSWGSLKFKSQSLGSWVWRTESQSVGWGIFISQQGQIGGTPDPLPGQVPRGCTSLPPYTPACTGSQFTHR